MQSGIAEQAGAFKTSELAALLADLRALIAPAEGGSRTPSTTRPRLPR